MTKYQSPMELPDEHMRMVGIISAHWEWLEMVMERAIAEIMEFPYSRVALLTENIGFYAKCDLILVYARIFEKTEPTTWKLFTTTIQTMRDAYAERSKYVHTKWKRDITTKEWGRADIRTKGGKLAIVDEKVELSALETTAAQIWTAGENFILLCRAHGVLLPSPDTLAPRHPAPEPTPQK